MTLRRVEDHVELETASVRYDAVILACGEEQRCSFFARQHKDAVSAAYNRLVLAFPDSSPSPARARNDLFFSHDLGLPLTVCDPEDETAIYRLLTSTASVHPGPRMKVLVDYSSMTRVWYAAVLQWVRVQSLVDQVDIDFVYSAGSYPDDWRPKVVHDIVSIPGCDGVTRFARTAAVFGLGFDKLAPLSVLERLEPDHVVAFHAMPASNPGYGDRALLCNELFNEEVDFSFSLPLMSVETAYRVLAEITSGQRSCGQGTVLVPLGAKPHVLASLLVSHRFPEVPCLRVLHKRSTAQDVMPTGELSITRVVYDRPESDFLGV